MIHVGFKDLHLVYYLPKIQEAKCAEIALCCEYLNEVIIICRSNTPPFYAT